MRRNGHAETLEGAVSERLVATFDAVQPHVQDVQVDEVLLLELPMAGALPRSRLTGTLAGIRDILPSL